MKNKTQFIKELKPLVNITVAINTSNVMNNILSTNREMLSQKNYMESLISKQNNNKELKESTLKLFQEHSFDIIMSIIDLATTLDTKHFLHKIRKCNTWEQVLQLKDDFIDLISNNIDIFNDNDVTIELNEFNWYYLFLVFISNVGIYAVIDTLYLELGANNFEKRYKFDYFLDGFPLSTAPVPITDLIECDNENEELVEAQKSFCKYFYECEKHYIEEGGFSNDLLTDPQFLSILTASTKSELESQRCSTKSKFRATIRDHIRMVECICLALYECDLGIDSNSYFKITSFIDEYKQKISQLSSPSSVTACFEEHFDEFKSLTEQLKNSLFDFSTKVFKISNLIDTSLIIPKKKLSLFLQKNAFLVINQHIYKVRKLALEAVNERTCYERDLLESIFYATECRIHELKKEAENNNQNSINTKNINKKIAKLKKIFKYRELNKLAENAGLQKVRHSGDHAIFKTLDGEVVVIPQGRTICRSLSNKIQRDILKIQENNSSQTDSKPEHENDEELLLYAN